MGVLCNQIDDQDNKKMIKINTFVLERKSIIKGISLCFKEKKLEEALLPKRERN